mmetsp:Transcript_59784/g.140874  ORF Transcript_59784/g.140874 Transcript_59784/m.140874 type:complete len:551 (+) Transcript_59784:204-1856(+)
MPYSGDFFKPETLVIRQQYDANASLSNMLTVKGTVIELVFTKPIFWILCSLHYMLWFLKEFHHCRENGVKVESTSTCTSAYKVFHDYPLRLGDIDMLSALVTFFVVFYNGSCFTKYNVMYNNVIAIQGKIHNVGLYLRAYYTKSSTRWNVIRYLLASHFLFYYSLRRRYKDWGSSQYSEDPGTEAEFCNSVLLKKGVLIQPEYDTLLRYKGSKHKLLYSWSVIAMKRIMQAAPPKGEKGNPMLNTEFEQTALMTNLKKEIIGMRQSIGTIDNSMLFPIPFQYYHIVNVTLVVFLHLLAYGFLFMADKLGSVFSLVAYPLVAFVLMGLLEVANAMSDPFGTDACDFNQEAITEGIYKECKSMCEQPPEPFLSQLGDPNFNPSRNADGTLTEGPQQGPPSGASMPEKEIMWSQADVQAVLDERDQLQKEFDALGIDALTSQIQALVTMQQSVCDRLQTLDNIPKELQAANYSAVERVGRLEALMSNQMSRLQGELRGDPYELRYTGQDDSPKGSSPMPQANRRRASLVPMSGDQPPLPYRRPSQENAGLMPK